MATILIADDDPIIRMLASEMLRSTEHAAILAEDGMEVLRLLERLSIDLLVTDMLMPKMDGVEVIMAARAQYPDMKILAISSGGSVGATYMLKVASTLGAHATLTKPLRIGTFVSTIDRLLQDMPVDPYSAKAAA